MEDLSGQGVRLVELGYQSREPFAVAFELLPVALAQLHQVGDATRLCEAGMQRGELCRSWG